MALFVTHYLEDYSLFLVCHTTWAHVFPPRGWPWIMSPVCYPEHSYKISLLLVWETLFYIERRRGLKIKGTFAPSHAQLASGKYFQKAFEYHIRLSWPEWKSSDNSAALLTCSAASAHSGSRFRPSRTTLRLTTWSSAQIVGTVCASATTAVRATRTRTM